MSNIKVTILPSIPKEASLTSNEIKNIVNNSLAILRPGLTDKLEVEIMFVDTEQIKDLNKRHRNIDTPTDVLSFPQSQFKEVKTNILGSIVISSEVVDEKNEDMTDVIKHALMHLLGYDHEEDSAEWEKAAKTVDCRL